MSVETNATIATETPPGESAMAGFAAPPLSFVSVPHDHNKLRSNAWRIIEPLRSAERVCVSLGAGNIFNYAG